MQYGSGDSVTFNTGDNTSIILGLYAVGTTAVTDNISTWKNIQLESGSTVGDYEPYTGGIPAPNPSYPYPINKATGNQNVKIENKNLISSVARSNNVLYFNGSNENVYPFKAGTYTFSYSDTNNCSLYYKTANTSSTSLGSNKTVTFTINEDFNVWLYRSGMTDNEVTNIQLEKGSTATTYVPHQEQNYPITMGSLEAYDTDYFFKNEVGSADYNSNLDLDEWYLKSNYAKIILDGSEEWVYPTQIGSNNYYRYENQDFRTNNCLIHSVYLSNRFIYNGTSSQVEQNVITNTSTSNTNRLWITIDTSLMSGNTVNDFKTWLSTHNTIVVYELSTPTFTKITDTTLIDELNNLQNNERSYKDTTNITVTGNLPLIISASAYRDLTNLFESEGV